MNRMWNRRTVILRVAAIAMLAVVLAWSVSAYASQLGTYPFTLQDNGTYTDSDGRTVNYQGYLVNAENQYVDINGNTVNLDNQLSSPIQAPTPPPGLTVVKEPVIETNEALQATPTPTPEPKTTPTPTPEPETTPTPTPKPEATPTPTPEPEATPTLEPEATPTPEPAATPTTEPTTDSGTTPDEPLSPIQIAGIAAGGTVGILLLFMLIKCLVE